MKNTSSNSSIGVAFLGVGRMGETHLRNLAGLSGVKVVVVADPRREAAERGKAISGGIYASLRSRLRARQTENRSGRAWANRNLSCSQP
jgi:predicted dehydrogenase